MIISAIVAKSINNVIGKDNGIPWYLSGDLKYFKAKTTGHHIIMGRNCFESIGRPLPKRTNIIVTRNLFYIASGCIMVHDIGEALEIARENGESEVFIIGGGELYRQTVDLWDRLYLTEVETEIDGDVFFPDINTGDWEVVFSESHPADEKNDFPYTFKILEKNR
jgi:dihydrofolate reductase